MTSSWLALTELALVLGVGLGWAVWQVVGLRRDRKRSEREASHRERDRPG